MTLTELFTNIANAIRAKTGSTEPIIAEDFPSAIEAIEVGSTIDLDAEVTEQETIAASQDALVGNIMAALEGKAVGGVTPPAYELSTRTINYETTDTEIIYFKYLAPDENGIVVWKQTEELTGIGSISITALLNSWINIYCESGGGVGFSTKYKLSISETPDDTQDTFYCITFNDTYTQVASGALLAHNIIGDYQFNVSWEKQ